MKGGFLEASSSFASAGKVLRDSIAGDRHDREDSVAECTVFMLTSVILSMNHAGDGALPRLDEEERISSRLLVASAKAS